MTTTLSVHYFAPVPLTWIYYDRSTGLIQSCVGGQVLPVRIAPKGWTVRQWREECGRLVQTISN